MNVITLPLGQLEANCYIVADEDTGEAIVVDPGDEPSRILEEIKDLKIKYIVLTHAHFDHAGATAEIKEATGAEVIIHEAEAETYNGIADQGVMFGFKIPSLPAPDILVKEEDEINFGKLSFMVIHTPGHTPGGMCLYIDELVITGDTLFAGSVGRTDFPGGSIEQLGDSFRRLMSLPDKTVVLSGHGPSTTIGAEKSNNMFASQFMR